MYKNSKVAVIIAAAGKGRRLGSTVPKQYLKIGGEYVIAKTIKAFEDIDEIDYIFVVTNNDYTSMCAEIVDERGFTKVEGIVPGGKRRQDSVYNALQEINARKPGVSMVLIHDGARPFVEKNVILNVLEETENNGAAVACVAMKNSVRMMEAGGQASKSVDRTDYYSVQTPQGFRKSMLIDAYDRAYDDDFERIPLDLQVGVTKRLIGSPLRISATLSRLNNWDQGFIKHLAIGGDLLLGTQFYVSAGYNFRRASEMKITDSEGSSSHGAGLSLGGGIQLQRFKLNVGYAKYHVSASSLLINATYVL